MKAECSFTVGWNHSCLPGHFPGNPVVPGVLVLEHVMRAVSKVNFPAIWSNVKFIHPVVPGDRVDIHLTYDSVKVGFECRVGEQVVVLGVLWPILDNGA